MTTISNLTAILVLLLFVDSIVILYATYKQKWTLFGVCVAIAVILDVVIVKSGS